MAFKLSNTVLNEIYSIKVFMVRGKFVYLHESLTRELVESSPALSVYSREHFLKNSQKGKRNISTFMYMKIQKINRQREREREKFQPYIHEIQNINI